MTTHHDPAEPTTPVPVAGCAYCVDGYAPLALDPVLGALFTLCPGCVEPCPECDYRGAWISTCCLPHLVQRLRALQVRPVFCPYCRALVQLLDDTGQVLWS